MVTEDKSSQYSDQMEKFITQLSGDRYKVIVESDDTGHSKISGEFPPRKTWWDWLQLSIQIIAAIAVPLSIIIGLYQFNAQQQSASQNAVQQQQLTREQEAASAQMQATQEAASAAQALDQQRQTTLDTYLDRMSDLLLKENLRTNGDAQALAQARTYTAVRNLDSLRKGTLVRFLWEAHLINGPQPIISLSGADLSGAVFANGDLSGVNLSGVNLSGANLSGANLSGTDLDDAYFTGADLSGADLLVTTLYNVHMNRANLSGAYVLWAVVEGDYGCGQYCPPPPFLSGKSLDKAVSGAIITHAHLYPYGLADQDLRGAPLEGAYLSNIELAGADLSGADLSGADLSGANLSYAKLNGANLNNVNLSCTNQIVVGIVLGTKSCVILNRADLSGADLSGANLSGADLSGAHLHSTNNLTQQQLDEVSTCYDASLPPKLTCHHNQPLP